MALQRRTPVQVAVRSAHAPHHTLTTVRVHPGLTVMALRRVIEAVIARSRAFPCTYVDAIWTNKARRGAPVAARESGGWTLVEALQRPKKALGSRYVVYVTGTDVFHLYTQT